MDNHHKEIVILMADDDPDDRMLTKEAFEAGRLINDLRFVVDGVELMDYLQRRGAYADPEKSPRPGLILLDLNMPRMDGREALAHIKKDPNLQSIPIVVLTTSKAEEDIGKSYAHHANSFITKPVSFEGLTEVVKALCQYWFAIVELPAARDS
jgi:CheY-like chemotaxis protein